MIETIKGGCPICHGNVKGDDRYLFFCQFCGVLYRREHLLLSVETVHDKVKEAIVTKYRRAGREPLKLEIEKRHVNPAIVSRPKHAHHRELKAKQSPMRIVNLFISADMGKELPLKEIADIVPGATLDTKRFPGVIVKTGFPRATVMLFGSGKIVCTGVVTENDAKDAVSMVIDMLSRVGVDGKVKQALRLSTDNVTCSGELGFELNLNRLAMKLSNTDYEPEQFPGLIYKILEPRVTFILFENGKLVSAGAKTKEETDIAFHIMLDNVKRAN